MSKTQQPEFTFKKLRGHLKTVTTHKRFVRRACFRMGIYRQGILHDMSKFSPTEFIPSVRFYDGTHSPTVEERKLNGYSVCWIHHKGCNRHHYEYWQDYSIEKGKGLIGCRMPLRFVAEMVGDRYAACRAYNGENYTQRDAWTYFEKTIDTVLMDSETKLVLAAVLWKMREDGEEAAFSYMKQLLRITRDADYTAETFGIHGLPEEYLKEKQKAEAGGSCENAGQGEPGAESAAEPEEIKADSCGNNGQENPEKESAADEDNREEQK